VAINRVNMPLGCEKTVCLQHCFYTLFSPNNTLCLKNCTPKAGRHKFCYFPNTKNPKYTFCREFHSE